MMKKKGLTLTRKMEDREMKTRKRQRNTAKYQIPKDTKIDYKNLNLLQRYLNDRGKIVARRISGVSAKDQRQIVQAIKRARFLALVQTGAVKQ